MTSLLTSLLLLPAFTSPLDAGEAVELRYRGTLTEAARDSDESIVKRFSFYCLTSKAANGGRRLSFLLDERGGGGWPWPERFGMSNLTAENKPTDAAQIRLLYTHDGKPTSIRLRRPLFRHVDKMGEGKQWADGKNKYSVVGSTKIQDMDCWKIKIATNFGLQEDLAVEKQSGLVVSSQRRLTRGQGVPFSLKFELQSLKSIDAKRLALLQKPVEALAKLQVDLMRPENAMDPTLSEAQLKLTAGVIGDLQKAADETPFARLAATIHRDVKKQMRRYGDVKKLSTRFSGRKAPKFSLATVDRKEVAAEEMQGNIVVLHFWDYKYEPLIEPYGQTAYLDFSYTRYEKLGVKVYGVAVNSRFDDATTRTAARQSARKFKNFMNLSYPLAYDGGELIGKFGDPRRVGAKLPLWVVIGADGIISHYKLGFYNINPDEGLRSLDRAVGKAVRAKRKAKKAASEEAEAAAESK